MNTTSRLNHACLIVAAILASTSTATTIRAQDVVKANNTDALNLGSSWVGGSTPTSSNVAVWNSTVTASNTTALGADISIAGLKIVNPTGLVNITAGNTLTLGASGIDMGSATSNLTIGSALLLAQDQTWSQAGNRILTVSGAVDNGGYTLTISNTAPVQTGFLNTYLNGIVSGTGGLVKKGSGSLRMGNVVHSFTGDVTLDGGFLNAGNNATALGSGASKLTLTSGTLTAAASGARNFGRDTTVSGDVTFWNNNSSSNGAQSYTFGTLRIGAHTFTVTANGSTSGTLTYGATTLTGNPTFDVGSRENNVVVLGAMGESGASRSFTKAGVGTLRFTGASTYTGTTTISGGLLELTGAGSLPTAGAVINDAILNVSGITASGITIGSLAGSGDVILGAKSLTVGNAANTLLSGELTGVGGSLVKQGAGTLTLSGSNSYSGGTTISAGMLTAANAAALGSAGTITIGGSGMLGIADGITFSRDLTIDAGGRVRTGNGSSVVLPSVAALAAWESISTAGAGTLADILFATDGSAGGRTLASSWVAGNGEGQFSDILGLTGTGDSTFVLAMQYFGSPELPLLNIGYRSTPAAEFTPLGIDFVGFEAWNTSFQTVGQYGIDSQTNTVWVVADTNSQFVVMALAVPEPATIALAGMGLLGVVWMSRRRTRGVRSPA